MKYFHYRQDYTILECFEQSSICVQSWMLFLFALLDYCLNSFTFKQWTNEVHSTKTFFSIQFILGNFFLKVSKCCKFSFASWSPNYFHLWGDLVSSLGQKKKNVGSAALLMHSLKLNFVKYLFGVKCLLEFIVDSVRFLYTGVLGGLPNVDIFLRNMLGIDSMGKPRVG